MKKLFLKSLFAAACCLVFPAGMFAQFSGSGSGTKDDPYRIFNADQLNQVRNFVGKTVYFSLEADIDMTQWIAENNPSQGWLPIGGGSTSSFSGIFNGNGHTISNLWINRPNPDLFSIGLFGYCDNADIRDLKLENADIIGRTRIGGIIGYCRNTNITSCVFKGKITGFGNIGGICGGFYNDYSNMTISDCHSHCQISSNLRNDLPCEEVGGICGIISYNYNTYTEGNSTITISGCYSHININNGGRIGGICGRVYIEDNCSLAIYDCHSYNHIKGFEIGGICGDIEGDCEYITISGCYSHNHIQFYRSIGNFGGICGSILCDSEKESNISISNCYSGGECIGENNGPNYDTKIGGIVGYADNININKCYSNYSTITNAGFIGGIFGGGIDKYGEDVLDVKIQNNVSINRKMALLYPTTMYGFTMYRIGNHCKTINNNLAYTFTQMFYGAVKQPIPDDSDENGTNTGLSTLKLQATYEGLGWDFADTWQIEETESFPYFKNQTAPPYFQQTLKEGDTNLSGRCAEAGTVSVCIGDKIYTVQSSGNTWSLTLDTPLQAGDIVDVWVQAEGKKPSYVISQTIVTDFAGGSGTESDPFLISTPEDLQTMSGIYDYGAYYKLTNDIDLTEWIETNSPTNGWIPVTLRGTFDGGGHTISGLWCDSVSLAGLFSNIIHGAVAKNIKITIPEGKAICGSTAGGIAGENNGTITYCTVIGTIQNIDYEDYYYTGGIVGSNNATIGNCMFTGTVQGGFYVGGIAGFGGASIYKCYTSGDIISYRINGCLGGIVGTTSGSISDCYSTADVTSKYLNSYAGGIMGEIDFDGVVEHCYSDGAILGYTAAGVCGYSDDDAKLLGCVAANRSISAYKSAMRVLGGYASDASAPAASDNYAFEGMPVLVNNVPQKIDDDPLNGTTKTIDELYRKATYEALGWDMENIWDIDEGSSLPYLRVFDIPVSEISLDNTEVTLDKRTTLQLVATVLPEFCRNNTLTWTSDNEEVATVDGNGLVTAVGEGTATITATANDGSGVAASCVVTVTFIDGIADIETSKVTVLAANGRITVSGKEKDDTVSVYDTGGRLLYRGESDVIDVPRKAMYIVTVSGKNYKVIVP